MNRWRAACLVVCLECATRCHAHRSATPVPTPNQQQKAVGKLEFEVASVRPTAEGTHLRGNLTLNPDDTETRTGGIARADFTLLTYIRFAYKIGPMSGQAEAVLAQMPKELRTQSYTIEARAAGDPTMDEMRLMMQSLLAERFKLKLHFDDQDTAVFFLMMDKPGKLGPRIRLHSEGPPCDADEAKAEGPTPFPAKCRTYLAQAQAGNQILVGARDTSAGMMAASLPGITGFGRPLVDRTGLTGRYDFTMKWTLAASGVPGDTTNEPAEGETSPTEALKEQLGMILKPGRAMIPVLKIDHVELPSEN